MASRLPSAWLDELRSRADIVDVVSDYVELKQKGDRFWGRCPFHNEKTPSFSVRGSEQMYYCFGCHKGGTVITFVMEIERMDFMDAVRLLADRVHMTVPALTRSDVDAQSQTELKERIYSANVAAARFYHSVLWTEEGATALKYFYKRGLDDATIRRFGLGSTPHTGNGLTQYLLKEGFDVETLVQAFLTKRQTDGNTYDTFRDRAMFPIINAQGKVLGFGGRVMGDGNPKYLNSSDTPVFFKKSGLYAMNFVRKERGLKRLILVEGYMDVVALRQAGIEGVVATLGTALTEEQARLIKRNAPQVWVCYDGDSAGQKAILRAIDIFGAEDVDCRVIDIPGGQDPDEYIREHGKEAFESLPLLTPVKYQMLRAAENYDLSTEDGRTQYAIAVCGYLKRIKSPVELDRYVRELSLQTGYEPDVLMRQIDRTNAPTVSRATVRREGGLSRRNQDSTADYVKAEQLLIWLIYKQKINADLVDPSIFVTPVYIKMAERLRGGESLSEALETFDDEDRASAAQAMMMDSDIEDDKAVTAARDCVSTIRRHKRQLRIEQIRTEIKATTDDGEKAELMRQLTLLMNEHTA
ncbi:MAG: DNA primase [Clostridia bacterium]|nr:DNA primase [Clostridia bacterium]